MNLSRKWLNEFVTVDADDKEFAESMTLSGSKVEVTEDLGAEISNVVVGRVQSMERHPDSDHMWVCQLDVGKDEPVQIVTGAWNIHVGDLVPVALHKSTLPGGKKIEKGKLRGVLSNGMLCSLSELGLDERDFPYGVITAAALLNDYKAIDPAKPSIPADIKAGDKVFGPVVCAEMLEVMPQRQETQPVMSLEELMELRRQAAQVKVADNVKAYILSLVTATRFLQQVKLGASPRGSIAMFRAAQAMALMNGRDYATPDDVKAVAIPVLAHRIVLASGQTDYGAPQDIVAELLSNTHIPM